MSNNNPLAFMAQQQAANQTASTPAPASTPTPTPAPVKTEPTQAEQTPAKVDPAQKYKHELLAEINGVGGDAELWFLTYMLHDKEFFKLKDPKETDPIRFSMNSVCRTKKPLSRLENAAYCKACYNSNNSYYETSWSCTKNNLHKLCTDCADSIAFCPYKMASYIEQYTQGGEYTATDIYREKLGALFIEKPTFAKYTELNIPREEYECIDPVCAQAAAELIKMRWIHVSHISDDRLCYSYLPICEITTSSFIHMTLDYYRSKSGKNDFIYLHQGQQAACDNRKCANCLFAQCPDKIAAYLMGLAQKYNVDVLELAEYVITNNKIKGVTLRGNFRYQQNLRKLSNIPFTAESRHKLNNIVKYIVNKYTVPEKKVPFLPFHIALYTRDDQLANETAELFQDFLCYYHYFPKTDTLPVQDYYYSEGGLDGLIKAVQKITLPTILHIKELALMAAAQTNQNTNRAMQMAQLVNLIESKKEQLFVIASGEKNKLDAALALYPDFYQGTLSYRLTIADMSVDQIVDIILEKLRQNYQMEEGFQNALETYVIAQYGESPLKSKAFIDAVVQTILFNHYTSELNADAVLSVRDIPLAHNRRPDAEIWQDLDRLTGLDNVKEEIRNIDQLLKFQKKMQGVVNTRVQRPNMHMIFTGNPGTGKTTVARLVAEILHNVGFIKQNKLVEVSPKDMIGQYIGHTAPKTAAVCESAYGGVLFIDEAYELAVTDNSGSSNFRSECVTELIKQMEDNRDKLVVIFAGYTAEIMELLNSNAGFASRIGKIICFEDYTTQQLVDMFCRLARDNGMRISDEALDAITRCIDTAREFPGFGNGRYVRNLYENIIMEHAKNTVGVDSPDALVEISENDVPLF